MKSLKNVSVFFFVIGYLRSQITSTFFKDEFYSQLARATREMNVKVRLNICNMSLYGILLKAFLIGKDH